MQQRSMRKVVPQACDACRRRKIKCNGRQPCPGCISTNLSCTFKLPQKRGGNTGVRATVLNQLRAGQQQESEDSTSFPEFRPSPDDYASPSNDSVVGCLQAITIDACIDAYLDRIHPVVPLLTPDLLREEALQTSTSLTSRQFIVSFCAYVVTFGNILHQYLPSHIKEEDLQQKLLDAALSIQDPDRVFQPGRLSVYISFFLYGAYAGLGNYRQGWFYLREATTLFMMQRGKEEQYGTEAYRCLFWVLVVSERYDISSPMLFISC